MMRPVRLAVTAVLWASWACPGCAPVVPAAKYDQLQRQWLDSQQAQSDIQRDNDQLRKDNRELSDQVETLRRLGPDCLEKLFHVATIELGRHTGGVDLDGRPGHDAIKVYLDPLDRQGSVIKAAGEVIIRLFDLAAPAEKNLIGEYAWNVEEMGKEWSGGFGVYRFSFVCPWKAGPPAHEEITVRVEFVDYLTGRRFTAQKACKVNLPPPDLAPASAPASQPQAEQPASRPAK
jgi:hypothetical protein